MLKLKCPWCGARHESEFVCGGPTKDPRPEDASKISDEDWIDYLTVRPNPVGPLVENWWHRHGCGRWFIIERNTITHDARTLDEADPDGR